MKKMRFLFSVVALSSLLCGCSNNKLNKSYEIKRLADTDLEFWITQRVTFEELEEKGCTYLPGWMGADEYLDSRYKAETSGGMAAAPDIHVTYLITGYPDTLDDRAITRIEITDPTIKVYGLTFNSTDTEITEKMAKVTESYSYVTSTDECYLSFKIKNCSFNFMSEKIIISVPVTNNSGVQY